MKVFIYIALFISSFKAGAQEWRDNLVLARKLYKEGNYIESLKFYELAEKKLPKQLNISVEKGQVLYKLSQYKNAEKQFRKPFYNKNNKSSIFHNLGNAQMQQKKYKEAIESYKKSLRINPNDIETRYNLSEAIRKLKKQSNKQQYQDNNKSTNKKDKNNSKNNNKDQNKKNEKSNNNNQENQNSSNNDKQANPSTASKKSIDKILEQLAKKDAITKRKLSGKKGKKANIISGKDW